MGSKGKPITHIVKAETAGETTTADPVSVGYINPLEFHRVVEAAKRERDGRRNPTNEVSQGIEGTASSNTVILDVRNWYESRVGHFEGAVLAPIRRFSQLPEYVSQNSVGRWRQSTRPSPCGGVTHT